MNILCKILGHRIEGLQTHRKFAWCARCRKGLKVSYDPAYGETVVDGDYGSQSTFIWCECGNELCSTDSHVGPDHEGLECYLCSRCLLESAWDFDAPTPIKIR